MIEPPDQSEQQLEQTQTQESPPPPPEQESQWGYYGPLVSLIGTYDAAQSVLDGDVTANLRSGAIATQLARRKATQTANAYLDALGQRTQPMVERSIEHAFDESVSHATRQIEVLAPDRLPAERPKAQISDAAKALIDQLTGRLTDARRYIGRRIDDAYQKAGRRAALEGLLGIEPSPQLATSRLADLLRQQGLKSFEDKRGRQWTLDNYAEMAARTTTREAITEGFLQTMATAGLDLFRLVEHPDACDRCRPWQGRLISISGTTEEVRGQKVWPMTETNLPPIHARCRCVAIPAPEGIGV